MMMTLNNLSQPQKVRKRQKKELWEKKLSSFIVDSAIIAHNIEDASKDVNRVLCAFTIGAKKNACSRKTIDANIYLRRLHLVFIVPVDHARSLFFLF